MKYFRSLKKAENDIIENHSKGEIIKIRFGTRTNGDLHLGNIFPIISAFMLGKNLIAKGFGVKIKCVLVDQEVNNNEALFDSVRTNENIKNIKNFISDLSTEDKIKIEYERISDVQKTEKFKNVLLEIVKKSKNVKFQVICAKCNNIIEKTKIDNLSVFAHCKKCNFENILGLKNINNNLLLDHDLLGAIENVLMEIDVHILGSDHLLENNGKTAMGKREEFLKSINFHPKYLTLFTPLVLIGKEKMSKSKKTGVFLREIKNFYKENYISKLTSFVGSKDGMEKIRVDDMNHLEIGDNWGEI